MELPYIFKTLRAEEDVLDPQTFEDISRLYREAHRELYRRMIREYRPPLDELNALRTSFAEKQQVFYILAQEVESQSLVGFSNIIPSVVLKNSLDRVISYVTPEHRGKGIFGSMVDISERISTQAGFESIGAYITSEESQARSVLEKKGYRMLYENQPGRGYMAKRVLPQNPEGQVGPMRKL